MKPLKLHVCRKSMGVGVALATLCANAAMSSLAASENNPPNRTNAPFYYYSYDMSLVDIYLGGGKRAGVKTQGWEFQLPRAMILFANRYKRPEHRKIPDAIKTNTLVVDLVYPSGAPLSVALNAASQETGLSEYSLAKSDDFRARIFSARLGHAEFGEVDEENLSKPWSIHSDKSKTYYHEDGVFDGLKTYYIGNKRKTYFYVGNIEDEFFYAMCFSITNKDNWCNYRVRINNHIVTTVSFANIVHHGGRSFANDRVRVLRKALCKYMACKMVADDGSLIREIAADSGSVR